MADYTRAQALATRLLTKKGFTATIRAEQTAADPVTGAGGADGADRTLQAVKVAIDERAFSTTLIERATAMLICDGPVSQDEFWVDNSSPRPIIATIDVEPDNASHVITKALIGG